MNNHMRKRRSTGSSHRRRLTLTAGSAWASFEVPAVEDYPPIHSRQLEHEAAVSGDDLGKALTNVLLSVATESSKPVLTAVCLTLGESPEAAAADGFRLGWEAIPIKLPGDGQLLIPSRAVSALEHSQDRLRVSFGEVSLLTQLVKGTFPNYRQLIPPGTACLHRGRRGDGPGSQAGESGGPGGKRHRPPGLG